MESNVAATARVWERAHQVSGPQPLCVWANVRNRATLLVHRLKQDEEQRRASVAYRDHGLVFAQPNGDPIHPERITKRFIELVNASGLRRVRLHDLRHGRASMLLASGTDIALVSKMLGHSSITLTADTYSHLLAGVGKKAAEAADALIVRMPREHP